MSDATFRDRALEQAEPWTQWDRRAWQPGTILALRELVEASEWCSNGVLSDDAVQYFRNHQIRPDLGRDIGIGSSVVKSQLDTILKTPIKYASQSRRQLQHLIEWLEEHYLSTWQDAAAGADFPAERAARFLVSHLLDLGFHPEYLRKAIARTDQALDAAGLIEELRGLANRPMCTFDGWVVLNSVPELELMQANSAWLHPAEVSMRMRAGGWGAPRGQSGALKFKVQARDRLSAAVMVHDELLRLENRVKFLRSSDGFTYETVFRSEDGSATPLRHVSAPVSAMSLVKAKVLYRLSSEEDSFDRIDDAFELASHLMSSPPAVAVSNAWAAIESLLIDPNESDRSAGGRVIAADRAAAIVANGWPRAELTRLSYLRELSGSTTVLGTQLNDIGTEANVLRCHALLKHWSTVTTIDGLKPRDAAAIDRMSALISDPSQVLGRVEGYMKGSFRRLYRQRNMVMHGGAVRSLALVPTLRTAGPLVGILLDRISASAQAEGKEPLQVAANAAVCLTTARKDRDVAHTISS